MSKEADGASSEPSTNKYLITEVQLGIWKVIFATQKRNKRIWLEISESYLLVKRLVVDIYKISPQLLTLLLLSRCWNGVQLALEMRLENILLTQIELAVSTDKANVYTTIVAICCKVMHSVINSCVQWSDGYVMPPLNARLRHHFQLEIMKANLMKDLPTSKETPVTEISPQTIAHSLRNIFATFELVFNIFSQLWLLVEVSRMRGGNMLFVVFLLQVLLARYSPPSPWNLSCFAYVNNDSFKRMKSLQTFADGDFHQDIISNNLGNWIMAEYKKAFAALGNISTDSLYIQFGRESPLLGLIQETLNGIPSIYFAIMVFNYPQYFSIAAIATLQTSGRSLFYSFNLFSIRIEDFRESVDSLRKLYGPKRSNVMKDGTSCLTEKEDPTSEGISFSLKDVSFAYPTGGNQTDALKSINLDIKAGQLVVIVGANGSGKSTLIRILARLYDPSSGELLVNGQLATEYCIADLHRATSLLSQDCKIYPLTLADNIGLGYPEHCSDLEMIKEAASEGGAAEFIEKLEKGYQTTLSPFDNAFHSNVDDREHPLWVMSNKMAKKSDISGGQQQRVIAARTFMRFKSGTVKFVVVDEPTSALDAESELQLFQRLMSTREGKTMVLVTHRFGHLTKFADQIICMKDGMIIERGTHQELMTAAGEYAKVYNIQAQAFSDDSDPTSSNGDL